VQEAGLNLTLTQEICDSDVKVSYDEILIGVHLYHPNSQYTLILCTLYS